MLRNNGDKADNGEDTIITPDPAFTLATSRARNDEQHNTNNNSNDVNQATTAAASYRYMTRDSLLLDNSAYSLPSAGSSPALGRRFSLPDEEAHIVGANTRRSTGGGVLSLSVQSSSNEPIDTTTGTARSSTHDAPQPSTNAARGGDGEDTRASTGGPVTHSYASPGWADADVVVSSLAAEAHTPKLTAVWVNKDTDDVANQDPLGGGGREGGHTGGSGVAGAENSSTSQRGGSSTSTTKGSKPLKRSYGKLRPILGGRFIVNDDSWHALVVVAVILVIVIVFLAGVPPAHEWWTFLVVILLLLGSITCALLCVSLDPGIVAPKPAAQEPHKLTILVKTTNKAGESFDISCTVCRTCHIRRPPRSTHCHFCDVCVEEFDHHCGVMGSCVGKRTYRFFAGFFMITTVLALYVSVRSIVFLAMRGFAEITTPRDRFRVAAAFIGAVIPAMFLFLLVPFAYVYLRYSCLNWTEKEHMRATSQTCCAANAPYDEGCCRNLVKRLCGPLGERHVLDEYWV